MNKRRVGIMAVLLIAGAITATVARAEEDSPHETARELMAPTPMERPRADWELSIDSGWLPRSDSSEAGGSVGMSEAKIKLAHSYQVTSSLTLTPEISYSLLHITAPGSARLPDDLHALSVGLRGDYRVSPKLSFNLLVAPGIAGDFRRIGGDDLRFRLGFTGRYNTSDKLTLLAGLIYQEGYESLAVFPIIGFIYRPHQQWTVSIAAPRTGVMYAASDNLRLYAGGEFSGGEYQLHDATLGAQVIRYSDFRVVGGADFTVIAPLKGELAAGYAFAREFEFYDVFDPSRRDIEVDAGPFVRAALKMAW